MAMTTEEVLQWLQTIKLSEYTEIFRKEEVDGGLLATYELQDLEDIGITRSAARKKILQRFRAI